jgi:predicted nucleic acid-binding protein
MIVLDTNVLSELMRPAPDAKVCDWFDAQVPGQLWISSITELKLDKIVGDNAGSIARYLS